MPVFFTSLGVLTYPALTILGIIAGPIVSIAAGFFIRIGILSLLPTYIALMLSDVIGDICWYILGHRYGMRVVQKVGKFFSIDEEKVGVVKKIFQTYHAPILLVSKLTMGFGFAIATLFTAGLVGIPFKRYMAFNVSGQIFWTGLLITLGFYFGHLYTQFDSIFEKASIIGGGILIAVAFVGFGVFIKRVIVEKVKKI